MTDLFSIVPPAPPPRPSIAVFEPISAHARQGGGRSSMQPDLRLVHDSGVKSEMCFASASLRPQPDPEALWWAFVAAQERSKRTLALNDGIAAGKAYAVFLMAYTRPATKGAA